MSQILIFTETESICVSNYEMGCQKQELVDDSNREPFEQPHGQSKRWSTKHLLWQYLQLKVDHPNLLITSTIKKVIKVNWNKHANKVQKENESKTEHTYI